MRLLHLLLFLALWAANTFCSCSPRMFTPPTRLWPQETSPKPLEKGKNSIAVVGGPSVGYCGFDFAAGNGTLTYRRGLARGLEADVSASYLRLDNRDYEINVDPSSVSFRLGTRYSPPIGVLQRIISARVGAGIGFAEAGHYVGFDVGAVLGWHNAYVVPFLSPGFYVSIPFRTKDVVFVEYAGDPWDREIYVDRADVTYGFEGGGGFKVNALSMDRREPDPVSLGFYAVGKVTFLNASNRKFGAPISIGGGLDMEF